MRVPRITFGKRMQNVKLAFHLTISGVVIVLSLMLFIYCVLVLIGCKLFCKQSFR